MTSANTSLPEPHVLVGAVLFLMTQHGQTRRPGICRAIAQQLTWLGRHPAEIAAEQRRLYHRLAQQWADMASACDPRTAGREALVAGPGSWLQ